ncbi:glycosyltransferase family 9 protein [candidate division KSB1 bacterium]|nr:glycosyltransferase family 9 protein [candidate division KSB1 bacterium]
MNLKIPNCRKFTGYRPCEPFKTCLNCPDTFPFGKKILILNLDHLGDVLMTTAQLPAIKRSFPESYIAWATLKNAVPLLQNNPYLDRIFVWDDETRMILRNMHFDLALNADKNQNTSAFMMELQATEKRGFGLNENGAIIPLNANAAYNYKLGLDDHFKFHINQKTGQEILAESFELPYQRDEYVLNLTPEELQFCEEMKTHNRIQPENIVIGFNTGCSAQQPYKKMTISQHVELIQRLLSYSDKIKILLLGGSAEKERNQEINRLVNHRVIETPTEDGLRKGLLYVNLCDLVVSGDTSGLHIAIGLKKKIVVWFGMSAAAEIDLYDRGTKVYSRSYFEKNWNMGNPDPLCAEKLDLNEMFQAIIQLIQK